MVINHRKIVIYGDLMGFNGIYPLVNDNLLTLKITNFEWKLIFQPRSLPGCMLIYQIKPVYVNLLEGKMNLKCTSLNLLISSPNALLTTSHVIQITWTSTIDWIPKKTPGQEEIGSRNRRQGLAVQTLFELLSNSAFSAWRMQFVCKRLPARSVADMFCWPFSPTLGACLRRCANEAADTSPFESDIALISPYFASDDVTGVPRRP